MLSTVIGAMTTKHKKEKSIARQGMNYVRNIVEKHNCIFQEIDLENDIGNDAYIEFIKGEEATGCCIAVQIKSGKSYSPKCIGYSFHADKNHFEYWDSHLLPIAAIIYNPSENRAEWCDITQYLKENIKIIRNGPYSIKTKLPFDEETFSTFKSHFIEYRAEYESYESYGRCLEGLAAFDEPNICFDAIQSLFAFHRNRRSAWFYLINSFHYIEDEEIIRFLSYIISHVPGHGDIFWSKKNIIEETVRSYARYLITNNFGKKEMYKLLKVFSEHGFERGTISQSAHSIISCIEDGYKYLDEIAFDEKENSELRYWALLLNLCYSEEDSKHSEMLIKSFIRKFPKDENNEVLNLLLVDLKKYGYLSFY